MWAKPRNLHKFEDCLKSAYQEIDSIFKDLFILKKQSFLISLGKKLCPNKEPKYIVRTS